MYEIGIFNAKILTMDKNFSIINNGTILIKNGKIDKIVKSDLDFENFLVEKKIDAAGKLIMPGLINVHTHSAMTIFRGFADDIALQEWLHKYIFPNEAKFIDKENVRLGTTLAVAEMLLSGTTTYNDMYFFVNEAAEVTEKMGMRALLSEGIIDYPTPCSATPELGIKNTEVLLQNWKNNQLIKIAISAHSPYSCSSDLLKRIKKFSDKNEIKLHIHLAETRWEFDEIMRLHSKTPTEYLHHLGILDENMIAAHSVHLTDSDVDLLAKFKVGVAHNPECNMKLASGVAPIPKLLSRGVKVGIGTDGVASNNNLDLFQDIRSAAFLHKLSILIHW
jgi:5-methylthioadenosine/S-adenosylhomocysteine deaminase